MKVFKRSFALILTVIMLVTSFVFSAYAQDPDIYAIDNGYLRYAFNARTGGFAVETAEGNPKKLLDNNIPLLYSEDRERSNGTSFITVRIGKSDYVFGQDYGFFGLSSKLGTPVVSEEGRLLTIPWTIKGVTVTLKAALSTDEGSDITGNVGFSFDVKNESGRDEDISVRLLLDTSLGNDIDAPYFVVDEAITPTLTETEYSGADVPNQIRSVDSLSRPTKLSYILTKGWNNGFEPNKVILAHWAHLANTRYNYTADNYCDFTNYSNDFKEPDSAAAIYWENKTVKNGETFTGEMLYGIGNFSQDKESEVGINVTAGRVELDDTKTAYKNDGKIDVVVEIDNTADTATELAGVTLDLTLSDKEFTVVSGDIQPTYNKIEKGEIKTLKYTLRAVPQEEITAGSIYASLRATTLLSDGTLKDVETAAQKNVILPSVSGEAPKLQLNKINPPIVYTSGEKTVTISGKMAPFKALSTNQGWDLRLKHTKTNDSVLIEKKNIAFLDDEYENMSFSTSNELIVGEYEIVFEFTDPILKDAFGDAVSCTEKLTVSSDEKYKQKSYGTIALVRTTTNTSSKYDFFTFRNEGEYLKFYHGELSKKGEIYGESLKFDFGGDKENILKHEVLLTVKGNLRENEKGEGENKKRYWQADAADGDIIINNMLSYEGKNPLVVSEDNGEFKISGDGLLKVINSINVWRSKWSIGVNNGITYTLDTMRLEKANGSGTDLTLSLDGAATMIQSIGGFLIDLKYGILSSNWYDNSDGIVTYGIGFGGSISIPIKAKDKKEAKDLTADQEDISEEMNSLFDESMTADQDDISGAMNNLFDETPKNTSVQDSKLKMDTKLSEGQLSAAVNNVLFGEKGEVEKGYVKVEGTGFVGIDAEMSLALPKDILGSLVSNAPGIYASVKINTIDNIYEINAGLNIKIIECEGVLAFKQVNVKNKDVIVPDKIEFYIRDGLKIPVAPPVLYIAGLGGGINELADTIGGEFDKLPPLTILLYTKLEAIGTLTGEFNAKISLEGMSLTGNMKLKPKSLAKVMNINAGISARWVEPWELKMYGDVNIIDGLIKGGITVTIANDYFYGYIYASICIPDSVPFVGGKELAGVEAAVSTDFIGANIKIIGISFGVIYYWTGDLSFGKNIDLSAPARSGGNGINSMSLMGSEDLTGYYGTNVHELSVQSVRSPIALMGGNAKTASVDVKNANGQDALLIEIPYSGEGEPTFGEIKLKNPDGNIVNTHDEDKANGIDANMLVQHREDGSFIYVTVTDKSLIKNGIWTVEYTTDNITINTFSMNGVDNIPELTSVTSAHSSTDSFDITASWKISGNADRKGTVDVYLSEDKDILDKIKTSENGGDNLGVNILHEENAKTQDGTKTITLPDTFESGTYYMVTTLTTTDGITLAIDKTPIVFKNNKLPKKVESVKILYGGNGNISVSVTDPENADYTHYLAEIVSADGDTLENHIGQFEKGKNFVFGKEAYLEPEKTYYVNIRTLKEVEGKLNPADKETRTLYYYGDDIVSSNTLVFPTLKKPVLTDFKTNFDTSKEFINQSSIILDYTFDMDVFMELSVNGGQKAYSGNKFKKDWKFVLDDLEDGDYVIDFTALSKDSMDYVTGKDFPDAQYGFTIDTSAPVLSLTRTYKESVDASAQTAIFGANTVFADENGKYTIEGITEKEADFTIDGIKDGITLANNGSFTVEKTLSEGEMYKEHILKAVDKAGNVTELTVYAVKSGATSLNALELLNNGTQININQGIKTINIKNGEKLNLSVLASADNGMKYNINNDFIDWNILYEKNLITFNNGIVTAVAPGETAVKAKYKTANIIKANTSTTSGLSDYAVINIANNSKSDLADKIEEARRTLAANPDKSEEKKSALQTEIDNAVLVLNDAQSTENDYTKSVSNLTQAISSFLNNSSSSVGRGSSASARKFNITLLPTENGKVTVSHAQAVYGTSVTVTAVPDQGFAVYDMLINGVSVGRNETYTIKSITSDTTVQVIFGEKSDLPFNDVFKSDWFYESVKSTYENKYMLGISDTEFAPNSKLTRAMFVTVLYRLDGEKETDGHKFTDVESGSYYEKAVSWASNNGIVKGISESEFAPNAEITREQMAAMFYRYAQYKNMDTAAGENTNILSYTDYGDISEYAIPAMQWTAAMGLIKGKTESTLNPKDNATRAETATVFVRFKELNK